MLSKAFVKHFFRVAVLGQLLLPIYCQVDRLRLSRNWDKLVNNPGPYAQSMLSTVPTILLFKLLIVKQSFSFWIIVWVQMLKEIYLQ